MNRDGSIASVLEFLRIGSSDLACLAGLRPAFEANADELVDEFYRHLLLFEPTRRLLRNEETRRRLLNAQREYLLSLTDPTIDEEYVERRRAIGSTHERVGLDSKWYLGAYAFYFNLLLPIVRSEFVNDPAGFEFALGALTKRLLLDAEIAIGQYIDRREEDLNQLNVELAAASQALSWVVDSTSRDLRQTQARADAAEQLASVATLVTGLAHEIGTPMGVLRGHAEALETAVETDRAKWRLDMILEQIDRITSIIQSLLNFARPKESLRVPLNLKQVVDTSVAFLAEKLNRHDIDIVREDAVHPAVMGDPEKLQQVFLNLLINAIDAMPDGGELRVTTAREGDATAVIRVADAGIGIGPETLSRIFEPFYTTKEAGHGNGLGLVVVQGIIEEMGGEITAKSSLGGGSEFVVRLPGVEEAAPTGDPDPS